MMVSDDAVGEGRRPDSQLLRNIRRDLPSLTTLADAVTNEWAEEDLVYRLWHQSFKMYGIR